MKLYTKGQLIITSFLSAAIVLVGVVLLAVFGVIGGKAAPVVKDSAADAAGGANAQSFSLETTPSLKPDSVGSRPAEDEIQPVQSSAGLTLDEKQNIDVYERLNRAVVNISTKVMALNWFLEPVPSEGGSGSGSIIDTRGYVLTNRHVVENAYEVLITLYNGRQFQGEVVGTDPETDLAVVKFDPEDMEITTIPMGLSTELKVGQKVLAIGNPFGYDRTLTTGIVSGLGRPVKTSNNVIIRDMIQTDASINPGNSGGPLLNSKGEMIGINTMIYSPSGGSVGIGFAVSVDTARRVVPDLMKYGEVKRGWIDIIPVQLFPELVRYADLPVNRGILISRVIKNGNADKADLRGGTRPVRYGRSTIYLGGDILVEVDGMEVQSLSDLYGALEDNKPGEIVSVVFYRGERKMETTITLSERPDQFRLE